MKLQISAVRSSLLLVAVIAALTGVRAAAQTKPDSATSPQLQAPAVPARITQAIDDTQLVRLKGNVHPLARPEFDQGLVADSQPLNRMLLLLQRSPQQETQLKQLLEGQQNKNSSNFHNWLNPQQFGAQFGPADADIQAITDWLTRQGFQGIKVSAGRTVIEFSGNARQVRTAFHTEIHHLLTNGEAHMANMSDPQIPAALAPVVAGVVSLHNFRRKSYAHLLGTFQRTKATGELKPLFTYTDSNGTFFALGPADFAKIYNVPTSVNGTGQNIAIVARSNINIQDVRDFRSMFGLPANDPVIILNGPDPGLVSGDETEADLDVEWSGAVAQGATINLVVSESTQSTSSDGVDLSAEYIVDNNVAPVMSESFGSCESSLGNTENQFYNNLWQQAAAEGITVSISAGDNGAAGCDPGTPPANQNVATQGVAVNGIASTPYDVALGGTDFNSSLPNYFSTYWNTTPTTTAPPIPASAKSYIPEIPWNDSCASTATSGKVSGLCASPNSNGQDLVAGSGGPSSVYVGALKPSWQTGFGDANRDIPDVSLFSADGLNSSFYIICESDQDPTSGGCSLATSQTSPNHNFIAVGGTSAAAPSFAAIMALVNQKTGHRQGNANYTLYQLAKQQSSLNCASSTPPNSACTFNDVTTGNNSVACQGGSPNCSNGTAGQFGVLTTATGGTTPAFMAGAGYDMATGLGTINVTNLVTNWSSALNLTSPTVAISSSTTYPINLGQSAAFQVSVSSTSGTPSGNVSLIAQPTGTTQGAQPSIGPFTLTNGIATINTTLLPGGTSYPVYAQYSGDGKFAATKSTTPATVSVTQSGSLTAVGIWTFDPNTGAVTGQNATSLVYGSPYILRVDVTNSAGLKCSAATPPVIPCPTGNVTLTDNGSPLSDFLHTNTGPTSGTALLNNKGYLEDQPIQLPSGTNQLKAVYAGDNSYTGSMSPVDTVVVSAAATSTAVTANPTSVATGQTVTLTAQVTAPTSNGAGPTGTVVFSANGTAISGTPTITSVPANFNVTPPTPPTLTATLVTTFAATGTDTISAAYNSGDTNYASSSSTISAKVTVAQGTGGNFSLSSTPTTVAAGSTANSTITVTPNTGFTGTVTIACGSSLPGVTCGALSINVVSAGAAASQLPIKVAAPSSTTTAMNLPADSNFWAANFPLAPKARTGWWTLSGGTGFAALFFLFLPGRKRYRAALGLGLLCLLSFTIGCGGSSSAGSGGTASTTTHLTVSSTKVASNGSITVSATVTSTGTAPTGNVQFFADGTALGSAVPVANGTTGSITLTAAQAPAFLQLVGTHAVSAQYLGDANTASSTSGTLNITITGTASLPITGTSGASTASGTVSLTIN